MKHSQVKHLRRSLAVACAALMMSAGISTLRADPESQQILQSIRLNQSEQHRVLKGRLRNADAVTPFRLVLNGDEIRYEFPDQALMLRLGPAGSQLFEESRSGVQKVAPARFDTPVRGTDIAYEDIALRFMYWQKSKIDGEEMKLAQKCWKVHVEPGPREESQYAVVLLWVEKKSGALLQAEGYDRNGKASKRFKVVSGQRDPVTGGWMLKQMRIEQLQGLRSRDATPTYLEIEK